MVWRPTKSTWLGVILGVPLLAVAAMDRDYPGPWRTDAAPQITRTLATAGVKGCGEFAWRQRANQSAEYLVYCTADGRRWAAYLAWTAAGKVMGPYAPDPSVPAPR